MFPNKRRMGVTHPSGDLALSKGKKAVPDYSRLKKLEKTFG